MCDSWHLPACQNYKSESTYKFDEKYAFMHREIDSQLNIKPQKSGGNDSVVILKNSRQVDCPEFFDPKRSLLFSKTTLRHVKIRDRKNPSQDMIQNLDSHERSLYSPKFEDRSKEETLKQERYVAEMREKWQKIFSSSKKRTKLISSRLRCLMSPSVIVKRTQRKENLW